MLLAAPPEALVDGRFSELGRRLPTDFATR